MGEACFYNLNFDIESPIAFARRVVTGADLIITASNLKGDEELVDWIISAADVLANAVYEREDEQLWCVDECVCIARMAVSARAHNEHRNPLYRNRLRERMKAVHAFMGEQEKASKRAARKEQLEQLQETTK